MNMMKKMYEDGDENMKRTIAEAWTKANDKKGEKPDFSDRYDFLKKWFMPLSYRREFKYKNHVLLKNPEKIPFFFFFLLISIFY